MQISRHLDQKLLKRLHLRPQILETEYASMAAEDPSHELYYHLVQQKASAQGM